MVLSVIRLLPLSLSAWKKAGCVEDTRKLLFGDIQPDAEITYYEWSMTAQEIAQVVFDDWLATRIHVLS
jgi:hypothetical protein